MKFKKGLAAAIRYLLMALVVFITLYPLVWIAMQSLKLTKDIVASPLSPPIPPTIVGYIDACRLTPIALFYRNSIFVAVCSVLLSVCAYAMGAYVISRVKGKLSLILVGIFSLSMYVPGSAMIQPVFRVILGLGLYDTHAALILIYTAFAMPISLFLLRSQFLSIPHEIEESAFIDGANVPVVFFKIMMPIARPGLATVAILAFIRAWNEFLYALVLTSREDVRTLPLALNYFVSAFNYNYSALFAALVMVILPNIVMFIILQERVIGGMTSGAVKG